MQTGREVDQEGKSMPRWENEPPPKDPLAAVTIMRFSARIRATGQEYILAQLLGPVFWTELHWIHGVTLPCEGIGCTLCRETGGTFWKGYAPSRVVRKGEDCFTKHAIELPHSANLILKGKEPRGLAIKITRKGKERNGELVTEICNDFLVQRYFRSELPPSFDVRPVLAKLWNCPIRVDVQANGQLREITDGIGTIPK
jgi:hypothetical protein